MNIKIVIAIAICILTIACNNTNNKEKMKAENKNSIFPKGEQLSNEWFTGNAFLSPLISKDKNHEFSAGAVTFEPNARTNWHTHPKGQALIVIEGIGLYQEKAKPAQIIKQGDVINIPENVEHWHGATSNTKMVHIAITNFKEEVQVTWLKPVLEVDYEEANKIFNQ